MTADRQFLGHGYTVEQQSRYGATPDRREEPLLEGDDIRSIYFVFNVTTNTEGAQMKSVLSKHGTRETQ